MSAKEVDRLEVIRRVLERRLKRVKAAVFAAGKLMVVLSTGPKVIAASKLGALKVESTVHGAKTNLVDRYRRIGWTELP